MSVATLVLASILSLAPSQPEPEPVPEVPGLAYEFPARPTSAAAPRIAAFTLDAGPDQSFLLYGEGLEGDVTAWGLSPDHVAGTEIRPKVQIASDRLLMATLPERCYDGPIVVWAKNKAGYSEPAVLNAPQPWWSSPHVAIPGEPLRVFGRNLARRPDYGRCFVYLAPAGKAGQWLHAVSQQKYEVQVELPEDLSPGDYQLWVHAGNGGKYGWGGPLAVSVRPGDKRRAERTTVDFAEGDLQAAIDRLGRSGGGTLRLAARNYSLDGTLVVPSGVRIEGAGMEATMLQSPADPGKALAPLIGAGWNQGPTRLHNAGDRITYRVNIPEAGRWAVWVRYATEMSAWKLPGVSKHMTLRAGRGEPVPLDNLPNTGSFGNYRWSRSAEMSLAAGQQEIVWQNVKGGGIQLDAFVFALDPAYKPSDQPFPKSGPKVVVVQAEDAAGFQTKEGVLATGDRAAVWLRGDGAEIARLTICGTTRVNLGIAIRSPDYPRWISDCRVEEVRVRDCQGKQAENCAIRLYHADQAEVRDCELWGRAPLFFTGVRRSGFVGNRLVSVTLWGGNAEAYILGRNDTVRECRIEDNICASPPGANAGGPTGRRLIWLSTGRGSVDHNWIAGNYEDRARFGGVAGTDQNVGEMILFEACERIAYYGPLTGAAPQKVVLPKKIPATPQERLGNVKRGQLAHDDEGNETPFWPPDSDEGTLEPTVDEYYVTILKGKGAGQTRAVARREGETYHLRSAWRVPPTAGSVALVHTAYYRNHIVDNRSVDGMTGIQLWISCIENVISDNEVQRMRKPGLYLYGNCTTLASSMPCTWNRGIGPLYFNHIEGTRCDKTSAGALVTSGEMHSLPVEFPRCLGNVLRHNSFVRNRTDGLLVTGNRRIEDKQPSPTVLGTIAEFNLARDATTGYRVAPAAHDTLLRRNLAYFWYPTSLQPGPRVAFQVDDPNAKAVIEQNSVEGTQGVGDANVITERRGTK